MNPHLKRLAQMPDQKDRLILGLMSGTSADGLDMALCRVEEQGLNTKCELIQFESQPYEPEWRDRLIRICSRPKIDSLELVQTHNHLALWHAKQIMSFLKKIKLDPKEVDLIASHGHTFFHAPKTLHQSDSFGNATFQIVDGDHIAHKTGIITIHDFRQKHIAAGGEGAPLALYGDFLLFAHKTKNRILLNIGGISNLSHLPPGQIFVNCIASDIGPGNTLMDRWIQHTNPQSIFDKDGEMASRGIINMSLLKELKENPFFKIPLPKTTGPETFHERFLFDAIGKCSASEAISPEDVMATLNRFTAESISDAVEALTANDGAALIVSGGGVLNNRLMENIRLLIKDNITMLKSDQMGVPAEAKEAMLFALLANEMVCGSKVFENGNHKVPGVNLGKISLPD